MNSKDERKKYLFKIISNFCNGLDEDKLYSEYDEDKILQTFLNGQSCTLLVVLVEEGKLNMTHNMRALTPKKVKSIVFCKTRQEKITKENMENVILTLSVTDPQIQTVGNALIQFYIPLLEKEDPEISKQLQALVEEIGGLRKLDAPVKATNSVFEEEFEYWKKISLSGEGPASEQAKVFLDIIHSIVDCYNKYDDMSMTDLLDISETLRGTLNDLWEVTGVEVYPEVRMKNLLSAVALEFQKFIQHKLSLTDLWHNNVPALKDLITAAKEVCNDWIKNCEVLSSQVWKVPNRQWHGNTFIPHNLLELKERLDEVLSIRLLIDKASNLLTSSEKSDLGISKFLERLSKSRPLQLTESNGQEWKSVLQEFDKNFVCTEKTVAQKLRQKFNFLEKNQVQLCIEFDKFADLISRPNICSEMHFEREKLLSQFSVMIEEEKLNISSIRRDKMIPKSKNYSKFVIKLIELQKIELKLANSLKYGAMLLRNLENYKIVSNQLESLKTEVISLKEELFLDWTRDAQEFFKYGLEVKGQLIEFHSKSGRLQVVFGERLIILLREVRALTSMGFVLPKDITQHWKEKQHFYKYGIILKQIAHFYNNVDSEIIPCQQPMMLKSALAFEEMIKQLYKDDSLEKPWTNSTKMEDYVIKLELAAHNLMKNIKSLRNMHLMIHKKVSNLINTDMVKKLSAWKLGLSEIRQIMDDLTKQGYLQEKMMLWKYHWDVQLYKALNHQYQKGLLSLVKNIPDLKVDLIYNSQQIIFRPSMEEMKATYFKEIKKFIIIPYVFKGVGNISDGFTFNHIPWKNFESMGKCFSQATRLFDILGMMPSYFKSWTALGNTNILEYACISLEDVSDWEQNFKFLKLKSRDIDKIPSEIRIGCVTVNVIYLKLSIEEHIQHLFDSLVFSLKKSICLHISKIEQFISVGSEMFSQNLQNLHEINQMNIKYLEMLKDMQKVQGLFDVIESKNRLLISSSGTRVESIKDIRSKWSSFEVMTRSHEKKLKNEIEVMKNNFISNSNMFEKEVENFVGKLTIFNSQLNESKNSSLLSIQKIKEVSLEFADLKSKKLALETECELFGMNLPNLNSYLLIEKDMDAISSIFEMLLIYQEEFKKFQDELWITFRNKYFSFDAFLDRWLNEFETQNAIACTYGIIQDLKFYKEIMVNLKWVRGDAFSEENWSEMFCLMGLPKRFEIANLTFGTILQHSQQIFSQIEQLKELNSKAQSEVVIRDALKELEAWGSGATFSLMPADNSSNNLDLIKDWKDLFARIGENQSIVQSLKNSPHYKYFHEKVSQWEIKISDLDIILHNLNQIQRRWLYLEPVFIKGALKKEEGRFKKIDFEFRKLMSDIKRDTKVTSLFYKIGLKTSLNSMLDQLQKCQSTLMEYLEEKRLSFPRFYFIGDDDLLEILGQASNPLVIQSHLKKLFAGINSVHFDKTCNKIVNMISLEGEVVPLKNEIQVVKDVEIWLSALSKEMSNTLKEMVNKCLAHSGKELDSSIYPSQVLCLVERIKFANNCETSISKQELNSLLVELRKKLEYYTNINVDLEYNKEITCHLLEMKIKDLIFDTIHHVETVEMLQENSVTVTRDWLWQKQLRFYNTQEGFCKIKMGDPEFKYEFEYTYEYQGNAPKLVHTPLTDKCYLTLTQALSAGLGGNPYGPAGTGKTESVKALGGLFGRQVLVFNCDEGIDLKSMGRIFTGLVQCGAWGCFDEFNRLDENVLSAVSMQIQTIQDAIKMHASSIDLLGKTIHVNKSSGIFITMNPASKDYGGRQKLPDNLKLLFRPVSMSKPDNELIAEVILFSEGFKSAKLLGKKIVTLFDLSRNLLSIQQHYDWGLRSVKSILKSSGSLLQMLKKDNRTGKISQMEEAQLVIQAVQMNTLSKLATCDKTLFQLLIRDVFDGIAIHEIKNNELSSKLEEIYCELNYEVLASQINKSVELFEQLKQRMGVLIVGPSGSGKSTLWKNLKEALVRSSQQVKSYVINPKSVLKAQLLGQIDSDTREWHDGILTLFARQVIKEPKEVMSWIVCDGDIDPEWIESLNSVLDDNHLLTLPSGERIQFGPNVNFIFETHDVGFASPATISRMGMIFLNEEDVDVKTVVSRWLKTRPENLRYSFEGWIDAYLYKLVDWMAKEGDFNLNTSLINTVLNGLRQVEKVQHLHQFVIGLFRGLSGNMKEASKKKLAAEIFSMLGVHPPDFDDILNFKFDDESGAITKYDGKDLGEYKGKMPVVITPNVERFIVDLNTHLEPDNYHPFIILGPPGCGKRFLMEHCLSNSTSHMAVIQCSAQTCTRQFIQILNQYCSITNSNSGRKYKPKNNEKLVIFLKGINLPSKDKWGTSIFLEFLRQILSYGGFYNAGLEFIDLERIQIAASLSTGSSDLSKLSSRITSIMSICSISYPDPEQLQTIYCKCLASVIYPDFSNHIVWGKSQNLDKLSKSMILLFHELQKSFNANDHGHYIFDLTHLSNWTKNLSLYNLPELASHSSTNPLLHVWTYEATCIFKSMLVGDRAKATFDQLVNNILENTWSTKLESLCKDESVFVSCFLDGTIVRKSKYLSKFSIKNFECVLDTAVSKYSKEFGEQIIIFHLDFLKLLAQIDRVLSIDGGSFLMFGRSGVGRKTGIKLIAYMMQMEIVTARVNAAYTVKHFKADLKNVVQLAVIENKELVLMVEDYQMIELEFYEYLNSLLSEGDVSNLFSFEELEALASLLRDQLCSEFDQENIYVLISTRIKSNVHLCFLIDWSSKDLTFILQSNPALLKMCSISWMDALDEKAAFKLSKGLVCKNVGLEEDQLFTESFLKLFFDVHNAMPKCPNLLDDSPRKFISLLQIFGQLFSDKKKMVLTRMEHLQKGLAKLQGAQSAVDELKKDAAVQLQNLSEKQKDADNSMAEITSTLSTTGDKKLEMEELQKEAGRESEQLEKRKKYIEAELAEIEPLVQEAKAAVGSIRTETLGEIRALRAPPDAIRDILEGVMVLMGNPDTSWLAMKSFLAKRGVKEEIQNFDARKVTHETRKSIESILKKNGTSFDPKNAKRASEAAAPLANWVVTNAKFAAVLEKIQPLEREQNELQKNISCVENKLKKLNDGLNSVDSKVSKLKKEFQIHTEESATLKLKLQRTQDTIEHAEALISKLVEEFGRWTKQIKELESELGTLHRKALFAAAFLNYAPTVPENLRMDMKAIWRTRFSLPTFDVIRFLCTENEQLAWRIEGLPSDELSLENAVAICQSLLTPLIIDPSSQSSNWLLKHYKDTNVDLINAMDAKLFSQVELAVKFGNTLIIQEMDCVPPALVPLLRRDIVHQGSRKVVKIGDKFIDYNNTFCLILTTRNPILNIPSYSLSLFTVVNFATTMSGLSNKLLALIILKEKPELEAKKVELMNTEESLKKQLSILENSLLEELGSAKGNILENKDLLLSLDQMKQKSTTISESLSSSAMLQKSLDFERESYLPLAGAASKMFFAIKDLYLINNMYHFSLNSFLSLYNKLFKSQENLNTNENIGHMICMLQYHVYTHYTRSLFKKDCWIFALVLIYSTQSDEITSEEWDVFIGLPKHQSSEIYNYEIPGWIDRNQASFLNIIKENLPELYSNMRLNETNMWTKFCNSTKDKAKIPSMVSDKISRFQELLVIQAVKPEWLPSYMTSYICSVFGFREISASIVNIKHLYENESNSGEVILFILSEGADPGQELENLAKNTIGLERYTQIALGQGQAEKAIETLKNAASRGEWLCLKNLHLCISWLPTLEKEIKALKPHDNFRLWATSESHPKFPIVFLQSCMKVTYEAPAGLKKNLLRTYEYWGQDFISCSNNQSRAQTYFKLAWFHAIVQERRSFIPQGWTKFYEFGQSDLQFSTAILEKFFKRDSGSIPLNFIQGLFEETVYGGKIDNVFDGHVLVSLLQQIFISNNTGKVGPLEIPISSNFKDYIDVIESLPDFDKPSFLGLPENIESLSEMSACNEILKQLKTLKQFMTDSIEFDRTLWSEQLLPIMSLWRKLNSEHNFLDCKYTVGLDCSHEDPVMIFFSLELQNAIKLVKFIDECFLSLSRILNGQQLLSTDIYKMSLSLIKHQTPDIWLQMWKGPEISTEYLRNIANKTSSIKKLKVKAEGGNLLGNNLNLSDIFHPDSFLNAFRLMSSRNLKVSIDDMMLDLIWNDNVPPNQPYIKAEGLKLECCNFDGSFLSEKKYNEKMISDMPPCILFWVSKQKFMAKNKNVLPVPVYANQCRDTIIAKIHLPYMGDINKWIQMRPSIFLDLTGFP